MGTKAIVKARSGALNRTPALLCLALGAGTPFEGLEKEATGLR